MISSNQQQLLVWHFPALEDLQSPPKRELNLYNTNVKSARMSSSILSYKKGFHLKIKQCMWNGHLCWFTHPETFHFDSVIAVRSLVVILNIWDSVAALHQFTLSYSLNQFHFVWSFNEGGIKLCGNAWKSLWEIKQVYRYDGDHLFIATII